MLSSLLPPVRALSSTEASPEQPQPLPKQHVESLLRDGGGKLTFIWS